MRFVQQLRFKNTVEANIKTANYLDVTLDLKQGTYSPYMKENNTIQYVHSNSNHPPQILKNIPKSVNNRLTSVSANAHAFNMEIGTYQQALNKTNYKHKLAFNERQYDNKNKRRQRDIIWFNPPFSQSVSTDIGRKFLTLI